MQTKIKYKMTNREKRENRWGILFSLPCILGFLIFALLPMAVSLGLSFTNFNFTTGGQFIGISNYKNLFSGSDPYFYKSLLVRVIYVALSVPTAIIIFFFYSNAVKYKCKRKRIFQNNLLSSDCSSDRSNGSDLDVDFQSGHGIGKQYFKGNAFTGKYMAFR